MTDANPHNFSPAGIGALREMIALVRRTRPDVADEMTGKLLPGDLPTVATLGFGGDPSGIVTLGFSTEEKKP